MVFTLLLAQHANVGFSTLRILFFIYGVNVPGD
jgi:hypothetical protein